MWTARHTPLRLSNRSTAVLCTESMVLSVYMPPAFACGGPPDEPTDTHRQGQGLVVGGGSASKEENVLVCTLSTAVHFPIDRPSRNTSTAAPSDTGPPRTHLSPVRRGHTTTPPASLTPSSLCTVPHTMGWSSICTETFFCRPKGGSRIQDARASCFLSMSVSRDDLHHRPLQ